MADPVLVVHGVANHTREQLDNHVATLREALGPRWDFRPVFWGDLGGRDTGIDDTLPEPGAREMDARARVEAGLPLPFEGRLNDEERIRLLMAGAAEAWPAGAKARVNGGPEAALRIALEHSLPQTEHLCRVDAPALLSSVGRALAAVPPIEESVSSALLGIDALIGQAVSVALGRYVHDLRASAASPLVAFLGDLLVYQRNQMAVQQRLWDAVPRGWAPKPVNVLAHSLGGVIAVDASLPSPATDARGAVREPLRINGLVTMGSQPALFHVMDPRRPPLNAYEPGRPVRLENVRRWVNLWEPMDFLGFLAGRVFAVQEGAPRDVRITATADELKDSRLYTHSLYWRKPELLDAVREAFS